MPTHDWTPRNTTFNIDYKLYHKATIASIVAISAEHGVELTMNFPKSVNIPKFIQFLKALRAKRPKSKLAIFMD
jgi:hypothetical protein